MDWKGLVPIAKEFLSSKSVPLLMISGTAGVIATVTMAAKVAPKAKEVIEEVKEEHKDSDKSELIFAEVKAAAPYYGPVIVAGGISLACFYGANHLQGNKNAALAAAASISERALLSYQDKVIERFGEEEHGKLLEGIADDILTANDHILVEDMSKIEGDGDTLCYDRVTGRYFRSTPERIRQAENVVVKQCVDELMVPLNNFYEELGLEDVSVIGEAIGWDITKVRPDIRFTSALDPDGRIPMLVLNYHTCLIRKNVLESVY